MKDWKNPLEWEFLNEPLYRWFLFLVAITFIMALWGMVLRQVRG